MGSGRFALIALLAACDGAAESQVDAASATTQTVQCTPYTVVNTRTTDGQRFTSTEYRAELNVGPATSFPVVTVLGCNPIRIPVGVPTCPTGFTCVGMYPPRISCTLFQGGAFTSDGRLSIGCGVSSSETTPSGFVVTEAANYYTSMTIRLE